MSDTWKVNIEDVIAAQELLKRFDKLNLRKVELYHQGSKIEISKYVLDTWEIIGMSNSMFVSMRFWNIEEKSKQMAGQILKDHEVLSKKPDFKKI